MLAKVYYTDLSSEVIQLGIVHIEKASLVLMSRLCLRLKASWKQCAGYASHTK